MRCHLGFEHSIPASISFNKVKKLTVGTLTDCATANTSRGAVAYNIYLRNFSVKSEQKLVFTFAFETHRFSGKLGFFFLS